MDVLGEFAFIAGSSLPIRLFLVANFTQQMPSVGGPLRARAHPGRGRSARLARWARCTHSWRPTAPRLGSACSFSQPLTCVSGWALILSDSGDVRLDTITGGFVPQEG